MHVVRTGDRAAKIAGARKLLGECAGLEPGESVLVVTDPATEGVARHIVEAARELRAEPALMVMEPRDRDGQEPPPVVARAMLAADVFLTPVSRSITHTQAVRDAVSNGARGLVMTQWYEDMLVRGGIEADFRAIAPSCLAVAEAFERGERVRLTSPLGTDLAADIAGRPGNALTCIVEPGQFSPVPTIEANVSPREGTATGAFVADVSVPYAGIGLLEEAIRVTVRDGLITGIEGGDQASRLQEILHGYDDPAVFNLAEIAIGLNPCSRPTGYMMEDQALDRTAHIGIGTSITLGGNVKAACHFDLICWHPTFEVDGRIIVRDGELIR